MCILKCQSIVTLILWSPFSKRDNISESLLSECTLYTVQQPDNVLVLNLLMHLELLKCGAQGLEKWAEIIVVGEVGVGQLWKKNYQIRSLRYFLQNKSSHKIHVIYVSVAVGRIRHVTRNTMFIYTWYVYVNIVAVCQSVKSSVL